MTVTPSSRPFGDLRGWSLRVTYPTVQRRPSPLSPVVSSWLAPKFLPCTSLCSSELGSCLTILYIFRASSGNCAPASWRSCCLASITFPPSIRVEYITCLLLELVSVVPKYFCGQSKMRIFLVCRDSVLGRS